MILFGPYYPEIANKPQDPLNVPLGSIKKRDEHFGKYIFREIVVSIFKLVAMNGYRDEKDVIFIWIQENCLLS